MPGLVVSLGLIPLSSPADVIRRLIIQLGKGSSPPDAPNPADPWPVFCSSEPGAPDNCITTYDTSAKDDGRIMLSGEHAEHHGVQVRVRGKDHPTGWGKAREIAAALDSALMVQVDMPAPATDGYLVWSVSRTSNVMALGKDAPNSRRYLFTINTLVTLVRTV